MSVSHVPAAVRRLVVERARSCCEYCLLPSAVAFFPHEVDHVVAEKHGGATEAENLAFTCWRCNRHKGTDLSSFDPDTGEFCRLFTPREQQWRDHFALHGATIVGVTLEGRATVWLLQIDADDRVRERQLLIASGQVLLPDDVIESSMP